MGADGLIRLPFTDLVAGGQKAEAMIDAAAGYRAKCERDGFSPTAAEAMAVEYHCLLMLCARKAVMRGDRP